MPPAFLSKPDQNCRLADLLAVSEAHRILYRVKNGSVNFHRDLTHVKSKILCVSVWSSHSFLPSRFHSGRDGFEAEAAVSSFKDVAVVREAIGPPHEVRPYARIPKKDLPD